jgi:hypothetical protein
MFIADNIQEISLKFYSEWMWRSKFDLAVPLISCLLMKNTEGLQNVPEYSTAVGLLLTPPTSELPW